MAITRTLVKKAFKEAAKFAAEEILAVVTAPAFAALENMATDLIVQVVEDEVGLRDGVDLNQTKQAGKDGLQLASVDGGGGLVLASVGSGGGSGDLVFDEHEHNTFASRTYDHSKHLDEKGGPHLTRSRGHFGRTKGKGDLAQTIENAVEKAMTSLGGAHGKLKKHLNDVGDGLVKAGGGHKARNEKVRDDFKGVKKPDVDGPPADGKGGGGGGGSRSTAGGGSKGNKQHVKPDSLRDAKSDPRRNGISLNKKTCKNDPVDVATGEMTLQQTDLSLPGVLPLVLRRTHLSEYRFGHWFGRSWASTLDERLELDTMGVGAVWAREDGSILVYPHLPRPGGETVLPMEGPRLPLVHGGHDGPETTYQVIDPHTGLTRSFTGSPYRESTAYWLTEIHDRNNNRIEFARRGDGSPTAVLHDGGYTAHLTCEDGRIHELALRTPDGPVTVMAYGYDTDGNLDAVTNSSGLPLRFTYDADARITSWTDRNDSTFRYLYDTSGRVVRTVGPDGYLSSTFAYDTENRITRYTDSTGATTAFQLNEHLQVIAETDPAGHTTLQEWDQYDRLLSRTDPLGHTTTYTYDGHGNLTGVAHPDGTSAAITYNELHQLASVTGPDGSTWRQGYDEHGNPTVFTRPDGTATRLTHNAHGHLTGVDDSLGALDRLRCDGAGLPLAVRGPLGTVTHYERDAFGRPTRITDPHGRTTELEWTVEGKLARRVEPDGSQQSWTYDGEGNCLVHRDAMGGETRYEYTHFDLVSARTTPGGARHEFAYDTELRLSRVTNPQGLTWSYAYGQAGRLTSETDFDGRTLSYTHDALGRLATRTNGAGQTVRFERDTAGRVLAKDVDGALTRLTYDGLGRLTGAVGPDAELSYIRDDAGRVLREICNGRELSHAYDEAGRRIRRTTPTGAVSSWTYPSTGRGALLDSSGHNVVFEFDEAGRETTRRIGETLTIDHTYDTLGRLTDQRVRGTGDRTVQHRSYTYRPDGHLTSIDEHLGGRRQLDLTREGRVTGVTAENWSERYAYDEAGNQTEATWPEDGGAAGPREYAGTRITRAGSVRYEHDAQGRVVLRQKRRVSRKPDTWRYGWDAEDRLVSVTTPDGTRWRYLYDPLGRRIAKQRLTPDGAGVAEQVDFTWDGDTLVEQTSHTPGSPQATVLTWDHDGVKPVTQVERRLLDQSEIDRRFFAIVTDLVGAPRELVDEQGEVAWRTRAMLWGTTTWNRDATAYTPLRFPGQYFDPESGLHYNRHRHYDPASGRYVSPDPLGLVPAPNPVTYVENPTRWIDPLGLAGCPHRASGEHPHSVVLGPNNPGSPNGPSNRLARWLRNDPNDVQHDPNRPQDPGAHTYNGQDYSYGEPPDWMTNVVAAVSERGTTLSITLDGMPNEAGDKRNWDTPESIVEAFHKAAVFGADFNMERRENYPPPGVGGTAWEMSQVAYYVRKYEIDTLMDEPEDMRGGRPWESIRWYTQDENGGFKEIKVPKPDLPEIQPRRVR
ncbi:RHS repeat-associated core domain-containing protein [Streptomyces sp. XD-27]|uniref:RHS repeat-associated core domain-containing protein n=1 Tax=Streptomyces sp. XD-27 TaxID=3062779 RepID=UPI0026F44194|nr:RHS repeat-associated core domain-containing protein [Streptomyces sp. XD-27]WKX70637.1 RHS repeat-associated core domain-containing protein [Streptomyces sp. XD-27]